MRRWLNNTHIGDCRELLREMAADGVRIQTCVTSPPYFGLRDYGTARWEGGDPNCKHVGSVQRTAPPGSDLQAGNAGSLSVRSGDCACGARRIDAQIGLESQPDDYVDELVSVFRLVRDVMKDDGTLWLNLGDSYSGGGGFSPTAPSNLAGSLQTSNRGAVAKGRIPAVAGMRPKNLLGIPWRVAFALQADGWYLRSDIIWNKTACMPEAIKDRPTKSHEYLFLLAKSERYYYDQDSIKEDFADERMGNPGIYNHKLAGLLTPAGIHGGGVTGKGWNADGHITRRNRRSVWTISPEPFSGAHFATFPRALIEPAIVAGAPPNGVVLDPFMGSGTTAQVATDLGRQYIGCELNPQYRDLHDMRRTTIGMPF